MAQDALNIQDKKIETGQGKIRSVVYTNCTFTKCNGTTFIGCKFIDCKFKKITYTKFTSSCKFDNTIIIH